MPRIVVLATSFIYFAIAVVCLVFGYPYIEGKYFSGDDETQYDKNKIKYGDDQIFVRTDYFYSAADLTGYVVIFAIVSSVAGSCSAR